MPLRSQPWSEAQGTSGRFIHTKLAVRCPNDTSQCFQDLILGSKASSHEYSTTIIDQKSITPTRFHYQPFPKRTQTSLLSPRTHSTMKQPDKLGYLAMGRSQYRCSTGIRFHSLHHSWHQFASLGIPHSTGMFLRSYVQSRPHRTHS